MPGKPRTLGAFIRRLRMTRRITQTALAAAAGCSQPYLSQIENGGAVPTEEQLTGIAGLMGVELRYLIRLAPRDKKTGFERGHLDDASDQASARELAKVYRCGKCGTRPTGEASRAIVDALAELRAITATAKGAPMDAHPDLWEVAQGRLDLISALVDAGGA